MLALYVRAGPSHAIVVDKRARDSRRERVRSATAILAPVPRPSRRPASQPTKIQKHTRLLVVRAAVTDGASERTRCCQMQWQRIRADSQGAGAKKLPRFRD